MQEPKAELTDKQEKFVQEYLLDLNATQAAIRAGYSEKTSKQMGSENLSKPAIQERIQKYRDEQKLKFSKSFEEKQELLWKTAQYGVEEDYAFTPSEDNPEPPLRQRAPAATVAAIKEMNAMDGDHAAIRQKITADIEHTGAIAYPIGIPADEQEKNYD